MWKHVNCYAYKLIGYCMEYHNMFNFVQLSVVYNDHSLYVWDVNNVKEVGKIRSFLFHSACVWDITVSLLTPLLLSFF